MNEWVTFKAPSVAYGVVPHDVFQWAMGWLILVPIHATWNTLIAGNDSSPCWTAACVVLVGNLSRCLLPACAPRKDPGCICIHPRSSEASSAKIPVTAECWPACFWGMAPVPVPLQLVFLYRPVVNRGLNWPHRWGPASGEIAAWLLHLASDFSLQTGCTAVLTLVV